MKLTPVANFNRALLRSPDVQKDPRRYLQAVQKVIACMTLGIDVSKLFSEMIMVRLYSIGFHVCVHRGGGRAPDCIVTPPTITNQHVHVWFVFPPCQYVLYMYWHIYLASIQ